MLRRHVSLLLVLALGASGCGASDSSDTTDVGSVTRSEQIPITLSIELKGSRVAKVENHVAKSQFILIRSADSTFKDQQILGVEPIDPIAVGNIAVRPGVAINPYEGDGKYTIKAGSPLDAVKEQQEAEKQGKAVASKSSIQVEWWPTGSSGSTEQYLRRAKDCTAEVDTDDGTKGRVYCPEVTADGTDIVFSLEMIWDVV